MATKKKMSKKKSAKKKAVRVAALSAEELVKGIRRSGGHLPTKAGEAARKAKLRKKKKA